MPTRNVWTTILIGASIAGSIPQDPEPVLLQERVERGSSFEIVTSVNLNGKAQNPRAKAPAANSDAIVASGGSRYRERILGLDDNQQAAVAARRYLVASLDRTRGDEKQRIVLRPAADRIILRRAQPHATVFCPDGPLMAPEVDLIEADAFTPVFAGLLPASPIKPGSHWNADPNAASELTGVHPIESGALRCTLRETKSAPDGTTARIEISGSVQGPTDQGPTRMQVDGHLIFDFDARLITKLIFRGRSEILDAAGRAVGQLDGRYELTRRPTIDDPKLSDKALEGVSLEATGANTALFFESSSLGVKLLYPRNWEMTSLHKTTLQFEEPTGGSMRVVIDPEAGSNARKLRGDLLNWLSGQKSAVRQAGAVETASLGDSRAAETFRVTAAQGEQVKEWTYVVIDESGRRATLSANLLADRADVLRDDLMLVARRLEFIAKSP